MTSLERDLERLEDQGRQLFQRLAEGELRYRKMARAVWQVQERERRRLARDLHDGLGQNLTAIKTQLEWIRHTDDLPHETAGRLKELTHLVAMALQDTREMSRLLRPSMLDDLGLRPALRWLARTMSSNEETEPREITVKVEGLTERFDGDLETLVFRIAQESVTNAVRHAEARNIHIHVASDAESLLLSVTDDGCGFDPAEAAREGGGLRGMRDRAELFDGRLSLHSTPGEGSRVELRLPPLPTRPGGGQETAGSAAPGR